MKISRRLINGPKSSSFSTTSVLLVDNDSETKDSRVDKFIKQQHDTIEQLDSRLYSLKDRYKESNINEKEEKGLKEEIKSLEETIIQKRNDVGKFEHDTDNEIHFVSAEFPGYPPGPLVNPPHPPVSSSADLSSAALSSDIAPRSNSGSTVNLGSTIASSTAKPSSLTYDFADLSCEIMDPIEPEG